MHERDIELAARTLWGHWQHTSRIAQLPEECRPQDRGAGYAIQSKLAEVSGQKVVGWKIAATSPAGQVHIRVDGPLAGRLLHDRVLSVEAAVPLAGNLMSVAEAEFAFLMGRTLGRRESEYRVDEVMDAVESLHTAIETPDSRYQDFTVVGAPQLIADNACACWFTPGPPVRAEWRSVDLSQHKVHGYRNGELVSQGIGANVLGDPRIALAWIANELIRFGSELRAGQIVTTGVCITPIPVAPGDRVSMDFGLFGRLDARYGAK